MTLVEGVHCLCRDLSEVLTNITVMSVEVRFKGIQVQLGKFMSGRLK